MTDDEYIALAIKAYGLRPSDFPRAQMVAIGKAVEANELDKTE